MTPHQVDSRILDLAAFNETRELIGDDRLASALALFSAHLERVLNAPDAASDRADILMLAHKLAPAAGSLGFAELYAASRALLDARDMPSGAAEFSDAWRALRRSASRTWTALDDLRQGTAHGGS
jgi:HPt (histidine-containing phosphotransfer) domain-containing protein